MDILFAMLIFLISWVNIWVSLVVCACYQAALILKLVCSYQDQRPWHSQSTSKPEHIFFQIVYFVWQVWKLFLTLVQSKHVNSGEAWIRKKQTSRDRKNWKLSHGQRWRTEEVQSLIDIWSGDHCLFLGWTKAKGDALANRWVSFSLRILAHLRWYILQTWDPSRYNYR